MTAGTLICIPKQYFIEKLVVVYDDLDRFTLIAYVNDKGKKILLGSIYMRPLLMKKGEEAIDKQFAEVENGIEKLLNTMC